MKVLHLPTDVGGNAWGLSRGERELGLQSDVLTFFESKFQYSADFNLNLDKIEGNRYVAFLKRQKKKISTFFNIRKNYDIFHFNSGVSYFKDERLKCLEFIDLPLYPKNAKLFVTYNGCDARQKFPTMKRTCIAPCHNTNCNGGICNSGELDEKRRWRINQMAQYTKHMWAVNPDLLYFLPPEKSSFLPYTIANISAETFVPHFEKPLKIVHAPTNREGKGSIYIISAVEKLSKKYPGQIEFILVENLPYSQAIKIYQQADLVIDQLLAGWYGAFAVEVMMMGKPVIARIAESDLHFLPLDMAKDVKESIINANPMNIYQVIEAHFLNREVLKSYSQAGLEYANKWHNPRYVAQLTKEQYEA